MASLTIDRIQTDILVVGAGGAGCFAAITAADRGAKVIVLNKVPWLGGCTIMARASYSAATGDSDGRDNPDIHLQDSVIGGDFMGNQKVLQATCRKAAEATRILVKWGADFRKTSNGRLDQGKKANAGHTYPRSVRVAGEFSHIGKTIMSPLQRKIREKAIKVISNVMVTKLLTSGGEITGAMGFDWRNGSLLVVNAKSVVVAAGGMGRLYQYTDNPSYITGDGYAAMVRAGAELVDMEFCDFQLACFYPHKLYGYPPNCKDWMSMGGILLNRDGERFFKKYFPHRENEADCLRTEINRAAAWEILEGRGSRNGMIYLNCSGVPKEWMMTARADMVSHFSRAGIDLTWQPMEVAPANHNYLGGLRIDEKAESLTMKGLYAAGEAAGGWGGANRLGGNAVAAALGLGIVAGESAAARTQKVSLRPIDEEQVTTEYVRIQEILNRKDGLKAKEIKKQVQSLIQESMWLKRNETDMQSTLNKLEQISKDELPVLYVPRGRDSMRYLQLRELLEAENLVLCGQIVTTAALARKESRGSNQRSDYPELDNLKWLKNVVVYQKNGKLRIQLKPVVASMVSLPTT